jgi:hypothetical protein
MAYHGASNLFIACDQEQLKRLGSSEQDYYHGAPKFVCPGKQTKP